MIADDTIGRVCGGEIDMSSQKQKLMQTSEKYEFFPNPE